IFILQAWHVTFFLVVMRMVFIIVFSGWSGAQHVRQAGFKLMEILLPLSASWIGIQIGVTDHSQFIIF
ncbi:hypothetical protein ACQP3J_29415, partial [Escherichia coli]